MLSTQFCFLTVWALCVSMAFVGYGSTCLAAGRMRPVSWPIAASVGIAILLVVGAVLEVTGCVKPAVLVGIVSAGDLLAACMFYRDRAQLRCLALKVLTLPKTSKTATALVLLLFLFLLVRVAGNLQAQYFYGDDVGAYLSFPKEMLELGGMPSDPFSARRVDSGLPGGYFLQALFMVAGDPRSIRFVDWGLGSVLFAGIAFSICARWQLSFNASAALALLTFLIPLRRTNATIVVLSCALFGTLFVIQSDDRFERARLWLRPFLLGLIAAALASLKAIYLPTAVFIVSLYYLGLFLSTPRTRWMKQIAICGVVFALALLPWMLDQKLKEGTFLFPIFGRGYDASAYGLVPLPGGSQIDLSMTLWIRILALAAPSVLSIVAMLLCRRSTLLTHRLEVTTYSTAVLLGSIAVSLATRGESMERYALPAIGINLIIFLSLTLRCLRQQSVPPLWLKSALAGNALWLATIAYTAGIEYHAYRDYLMDAGLPPADGVGIMPFDAQAERSRVTALPAAVLLVNRCWSIYMFPIH